jgi:toxin YoeB
MYEIKLSARAEKDLVKLKKSEPNAFKKAETLLLEIAEHPYTGTGKPKPLGNDRAGQWSRKISDKHRIVYIVDDEIVVVFIITASGHYGDK